LLALIVLIGHTPLGSYIPTVGGVGAVEGFFLISGFYMAATYTRNYAVDGRVAHFLASRAIRLYPLYFAILLANVVFFYSATTNGWHANFYQTLNYFLATGVWKPHLPVWSLLFQDLVSVHEKVHLELPVRQAWSISAEIVFYAMTPLLCRFRASLLVLTAIMFAAKAVIFFTLGWRYAYFPFFGQLCYFTLGMWLYFHREMLTWGRWPAIVMLPAAAVILMSTGQASFEFGTLLRQAVFIGTLVIVTPTLFQHINGRLSKRLGDLSYGVYLSHFLVFEVLLTSGLFSQTATSTWNLVGRPVATILITCAATWLFEWAIQDRLDAWRRRRFYANRLLDAGARGASAATTTSPRAIDPMPEGRYGA
jgi:peptidoglycan/LPS O-acetylase OafA/YrhL